jgi:uncharacterized phage protein (TIGR01671 family)
MSNRIIKFRAWDGKKMYLPEYSDKEDFHILADGNIVFTREYGYERHELTQSRGIGWVLMQFTGLQDKAQKDIYDLDIVRFADKYNYIVKWDDGRWVCDHVIERWGRWGNLHRAFEHDLNQYDFKVIGNLYENPDLIENINQ